MRSRPVYARAALMAIITASVPELPKRIRSRPGTRSTRSSASATSSGVDAANAVPRASCRLTASTSGGKAWPWISAVKLLIGVEPLDAVRVGHAAALPPGQVERVRADVEVRLGRPAGNDLPRALEQRARVRAGIVEPRAHLSLRPSSAHRGRRRPRAALVGRGTPPPDRVGAAHGAGPATGPAPPVTIRYGCRASPAASRSRARPARRSAVVVAASTIAGPVTTCPGATASRS